MKNNMNEMNDEMEITLNESYTFPVISKESFMRLADIAASTIKTLEPKFKEIKTDFNEGIMLIVASCLWTHPRDGSFFFVFSDEFHDF